MVDLVGNLFESFSTVITKLAAGLGDAFTNLIYVDGNTESGLSPLIQFIFIMGGVGLGAGILYKIFGLIRGKAHV